MSKVLTNRIIHSDNGTLSDLSVQLVKPFTGSATLPLVASEDYLYLASDLPFNHRYFRFSTPNAAAAAIAGIDIWDGSEWKAVAEVIDETVSGSATFGASGHITIVPDEDEPSWLRDDTVDAEGVEAVDGLGDLTIYNLFWMRIRFSADLDAGTVLSYVGHKFSDDTMFQEYYPDLLKSEVLAAWESGKTDWDNQHIAAADEVLKELRRTKTVWNINQVLDRDQFELAAMHKAAEIIYRGFGDDFRDNRSDALKYFKEAMNLNFYRIDRNQNANLDEKENRFEHGQFYR